MSRFTFALHYNSTTTVQGTTHFNVCVVNSIVIFLFTLLHSAVQPPPSCPRFIKSNLCCASVSILSPKTSINFLRNRWKRIRTLKKMTSMSHSHLKTYVTRQIFKVNLCLCFILYICISICCSGRSFHCSQKKWQTSVSRICSSSDCSKLENS